MQMDAKNLRYELKMVYDGLALYEVRRWVKGHSHAFRTAYPPRQVNNIYFDTLDLDCLNDHISGSFERQKLRFRWYGEDLRYAKGHLELKHKTNRIGWKSSQDIEPILDLEMTNWMTILRTLRSKANTTFREMLSVSHPISISGYQREYYVSADQTTRVTLDYDLFAFDQRLSRRPNLKYKIPMLDQVVIEIKSNSENSAHLDDVLAEFPLRIVNHSKYLESLGAVLDD